MYAAKGHYRSFYNFGVVYKRLGRDALAHATLTEFLARYDDVPEDREKEVRKMLEQLEQTTAQLVVTCSRAALELRLDDGVLGTCPLRKRWRISAGHHTIRVETSGAERTVEQAFAVEPRSVTAFSVHVGR
jgi:hypothetical protein